MHAGLEAPTTTTTHRAPSAWPACVPCQPSWEALPAKLDRQAKPGQAMPSQAKRSQIKPSHAMAAAMPGHLACLTASPGWAPDMREHQAWPSARLNCQWTSSERLDKLQVQRSVNAMLQVLVPRQAEHEVPPETEVMRCLQVAPST